MAEAQKKETMVDRAKRHFNEALDGWRDNRKQWENDLKFLEGQGAQWPKDIATKRKADDRPCLEINKLPAFVDQVTGDQLQNRPSVKFRGVDNGADPETAEIFTGLTRNIENISNAFVAYDTAFDNAVKSGFGCWRILTRYVDETSFNQEIIIKRMPNQFVAFPDPMATDIDYGDGRYWFITEEIPKEEFLAKYPNSTFQDWEEIPEDLHEWIKPETVRIAEYWYRKRVESKLYQFQNAEGETHTADVLPEGTKKLRERKVIKDEIWHCKTNGFEILEEPAKWAGMYFPIIPVWGKEDNIGSRKSYRGLIRHAKDPQRLYNYSRSLQAETSALAPKAPWLLTPEQVKGHEAAWGSANIRNWPYLLYNPDPEAPALPQRIFPSQLNTQIQAEIAVSDQEIHDTTGLQLASLGKASNERSGVAIERRQSEGERGSFGYITMLSRSLTYQGKVLADLIPKIYDTPRVERILGLDDKELMVPINQSFQAKDQQGNPIEKIYDLNAGKYDVVVTIGPSYQTKRQEAAENMIAFSKAIPQAGAAMMDLVAKYQDWPGAPEIERRLKVLLPPQVAAAEGIQLPQPPPDPVQQMQLQQEQFKTQQEQLQTIQEQLKVEIQRFTFLIKQAEAAMPKKKEAAS